METLSKGRKIAPVGSASSTESDAKKSAMTSALPQTAQHSATIVAPSSAGSGANRAAKASSSVRPFSSRSVNPAAISAASATPNE
jgi:hypothetical protein